MTPRTLYRTAAVLLFLFAVAHTAGFLRFTPPAPEALAVRDAMIRVHFEANGGTFTYQDFYVGFGLFATAYLLFTAFLAWHLSNTLDQTLAWGLFALQLVCLALSAKFFFAAPVIFSAVVAACLGWAAGQNHVKAARTGPAGVLVAGHTS